MGRVRHIIPVSGKDSCATAIVQMTRCPKLPYELFFTDVGAELPETYAWLEKVEKMLGVVVYRVGESLEKIIYDTKMIPSPSMRFCTRKSKIEPMLAFVGEDDAIIYLGIRADEDRIGHYAGKENITVSYPLREEGITLEGVLSILEQRQLRPPLFFWKSVYDMTLTYLQRRSEEGFRLLPGSDILEKTHPIERDQLFAWRTRSNCYFCFYQRLYEWAGLLEHHPKLFTAAQLIEETVGKGDRRDTDKVYSWIAGMPLSLLRDKQDVIKKKRVKEIAKVLYANANPKQNNLRSLSLADNSLAATSCGLFCGK